MAKYVPSDTENLQMLESVASQLESSNRELSSATSQLESSNRELSSATSQLSSAVSRLISLSKKKKKKEKENNLNTGKIVRFDNPSVEVICNELRKKKVEDSKTFDFLGKSD